MTRVLLLDAQYPYVRVTRCARAYVSIHHPTPETAEKYDIQKIPRHGTRKGRKARGHGIEVRAGRRFYPPDRPKPGRMYEKRVGKVVGPRKKHRKARKALV